MFVLYEVLLYLVFIISLPFFLLLGIVRGKYLANFPERMGFYPAKPEAHDLWIHAVSVGEALAAKTVVDEIMRQRPDTSIVFTTTTITGQAQAKRLYPRATVTYFPFDFSFAVRRFLEQHTPRAFATMETEIWPNVTRIGRNRGLRMVLANGRISDRSFPRYRALRPLLRPILAKYDRILAREDEDRRRFIAMGAPDAIVETSGNVKFDYRPDSTPLEVAPQLESMIAGRRTVVFGSTLEGEDEMLLPLIEELARHRIFVIVAPRKAERFEFVAALLGTTSLRVARRSALGAEAPEADVLLLDTFGELSRVYALAAVAFVGGSLVPHGGHNPIEPAASGVPVCFGPSMTNFREIASSFIANRACVQVGDVEGVRSFIQEMLRDEAARSAMGERAKQTVLQNRGASERTARRIVELLP